MDLKNGSTVLFVKDINTSKKFYTNLLGFSVSLDFGKNIIFTNGLAIWEIWKEHIIPSILGEKKISDSSVNRFELCFETENITEVDELLKKNKVRLLHEIHEEPWGQRTIRFFDPDNHLIEIGESMQQFVCRFYKQGLSVEQVSERTSVPVDEVKRLISRGRE
jgi:catechol 2,3-dioxygenase-like lactoylglutathione lyase family enzyme